MTVVVPTLTPVALAEPIVQIQGLVHRYGAVQALRGVDLTIQRGEIFGLIGPDGAGKTTTFQVLSGVMEPTAGVVRVLGQPPRSARLGIGYLTQQFSLYLDLSLDENLRYSAGLREVPEPLFLERRAKYLRLMGLDQVGARLAGQLSGGMKQKLALCCALVAQPEVLLLDEPTTGVDPVSRREFWDVLAALAREQVTIIVATPYLDEAERCNRVALMYAGQIQDLGAPQELRQRLGLVRLEVRTPDLEAGERLLLAQRGIVDVQTFGDRLDVLVADLERGKSQIKACLPAAGLELEPAEPTLENVFVTRLRQEGSDPAPQPFPIADLNRVPDRNALAIEAKNLSKVYGSFQAVKKVDLAIRYGEIYGLLGANGAGKTTTIKMLCGLVPASSGAMALAGASENLRSGDVRQRIGYMSQKFTLYDDLSILQNLEFYSGVYGIPRHLRKEKIDWVLQTCGLVGQEQMLTGQLPGGWKQRVAFGASVMHEPEVLFLDEPTSGVDPLARRQFWRLIEEFARRGTAVLVTTHYLEEAEHCNRLGFLVAGELVAQGSPSQIKAEQPGQLFEVVLDGDRGALQDALETLRQLPIFAPEPWRAAVFGDRLHLVLEEPTAQLEQIRTDLARHRLMIQSSHPRPFSLEDAFIGIVARALRSTVHG